MSFNEYHQNKVDELLLSKFKELYDLIPSEFVHNYYFEKFLCELARLYSNIQYVNKHANGLNTTEHDFNVLTDENGSVILAADMLDKDEQKTDKTVMIFRVKTDGSLAVSWTFGYAYKVPYDVKKDDTHYELAMKFSDDGQHILVEYTTSSKKYLPFKCYMSSIFDRSGDEMSRVAEGIDIENKRVVFHEEYYPIDEMSSEQISYFANKVNATPFTSSVSIKESQVASQQVYVCSCQTGNITRYAICWKQPCGSDDSFDKTFETVSDFGAIGFNLSRQIDRNERTSIIEISKEDYDNLIKNMHLVPLPQLRMQLK